MSDPIACPNCFVNFGFKQAVIRYSDLPAAGCPNCGRRGVLTGQVGLREAIQLFFVSGSYLPETWAPVYQVNEANPYPANFDSTLDADAKLASQLTGLVVFAYSPQMWRVGEVDLTHEFDAGGARRQSAAFKFVAEAPRIELSVGTPFFRIRRNPTVDGTITNTSAFDPPPSDVQREGGRWDDGKTSVLYVSDDIELCLHECRVVLADEIVVATLSIAKPLVLLDLSAPFPRSTGTPFEDPGMFASYLSLSRSDDWLGHARFVAQTAKAAGLAGIRYTSYYAQAKHDTGALNLALFGRPLVAGDLVIDSVNRLRLTDARYDFSLGPVLYPDDEV